MKRSPLTRAEEEVMQLIWQRETCLVSDLLDDLEQRDGKRPPHSSISSIVRLLEKKGYVDHKAYGRTYEYFPVVPKAEYGKRTLRSLLDRYFNGSPAALVHNLLRDEAIDPAELRRLLDQIEDDTPSTDSQS